MRQVGYFSDTKVMPHKTETAALKATTHNTATCRGVSRKKCRPCRMAAQNNQPRKAQILLASGSGWPVKKPLINPAVYNPKPSQSRRVMAAYRCVSGGR